MKTRILFTLALAALLFAPAVQAQTIFVSTTIDEADGSCSDGDCSLRDAVALVPSSNVVGVPPGTYVLTLGQITIDKTLAIGGSDPRTTIIDGNNASRIFETAPGTEVVFQALTLTRGNAAGDGGAVLSQGAAFIQLCTVKDNTASGDGGGVAAAGDLFVDRSTFSGNSAHIGGAIVRVATSNQTISNSGRGGDGRGGPGGEVGRGKTPRASGPPGPPHPLG